MEEKQVSRTSQEMVFKLYDIVFEFYSFPHAACCYQNGGHDDKHDKFIRNESGGPQRFDSCDLRP